jgi:prepilin-type N-terminal cleavage/methylation domain-containing protein
MKNKGFTLIEIVVVIAVIGVLGVVITISLTSTLQKANQRQCDEFVRKIEDAACAYTSMSKKAVVCNRNTCPPVSLSILISEGFVTDEVNVCTGRSIDMEETVTITWVSGEKQCHYNGARTYER